MTADSIIVELSKSGKRFAWDEAAASLLDFLEDQGLTPDFSCRGGICSTCKQRLLSGEVDYFEEPLNALGDDEVLLCCSKPKTSIVIEL
jgi:ferredoxin